MNFTKNLILRFWETCNEMSPYLLFGFLLAGVLSWMISAKKVEKHLGKPGLASVIKAALLGIPLPLCSCGVIPVAASLRKHGAGKGATSAFLISTPQTGVDSLMITFGLLGPAMAVFRTIAAFFSGILGGSLIEIATGKDEQSQLQENEGDNCCEPEEKRSFRDALKYGFVDLPASIGSSLLIGILIAALISALLPENFGTAILGNHFLAMLAMLVAGIPMYVCATASVPVAAAMIAKGISPGAALVFLMTGPATNAATIGVLGKTLGKRSAVIYLATVAGSALLAGYAFDLFVEFNGVYQVRETMRMMPSWLNISCSLILLAILIRPMIGGKSPAKESKGKPDLLIKVGGMSCGHCEDSVQKAALACSGVREANADFRKKQLEVKGSGINPEQIEKAIEKAGFFIQS